jgi:hypothetical protein
MATNDSFTVSAKGKTGVVATWSKPDSLSDKAWNERIDGDHSETVTVTCSKAVAKAVNDLAIQQWVIKAQGAARSELDKVNAKAAVQAKVSGYRYGARGTSSPAVVIDAKAAKLTKAQCELLASQGVQIINAPEK